MIGFAGLSHLGLVSSIAAASKGFEVVAYDPNKSLCDALSRGQLPIVEPELPQLLAASGSRLSFTADPAALAACDVTFVSIDVPTDAENRADVSVVERIAKKIVAVAPPGSALVILSQVLPGFTRRLGSALDAEYGPQRFELHYQVETLIFGRAVERALHPERFIIGSLDPLSALPNTYAALIGEFACPLFRMRYESAELAKISINMFLVSAVSTTNMLAEICESIGADWSEIAPTLRLDRRIGPHAYLSPGLGIGGGNLERDLASVKTLAASVGADAGVVEAWLENSRHRRDWVLNMLQNEVLSSCAHPVIAVWGLAYKENTASTKNSPALHLVDAMPTVDFRAYDPSVILDEHRYPQLVQVESAVQACDGADALAIMTPWREFSGVALASVQSAMRGRVILDPYGILSLTGGDEAPGLRYFKLGMGQQRVSWPNRAGSPA